ncbi:MAG: hypothetical protein ACRYFS_24785 [Janthinobacterium lividum]
MEELAEMAKRATEREIETEVVHVFKQIGWLRSQIKQDVPISDKGADKADIVLRLEEAPMILVEVKKHGHLRDADNQVNRYCRLLRPSPKLALLTDGVHWILYYIGQVGAIPIQEASLPEETESAVAMLLALNPERLSGSLQAGAFQYLDIVEEGLRGRSEDAQNHLRQFFISTVKALLLMPSGSPRPFSLPKAAVDLQHQTIWLQEEVSNVEASPPDTAKQFGKPRDTVVEYDALQPPPLSFTTGITANFAGNPAANWGDLLRVAIKNALDSRKTTQDIRRIADINIQEAKNTEKGFALIPGTSLSVQGQPSDKSWQNALRLAQALGCEIEAKFRWQDKEQASHPGEFGVLRWRP